MCLITKQEALSALYDIWTADLQTEDVPISECVGRVLAENVYAAYSIPVNRWAATGGIAVRSADFINNETGYPVVPDTLSWKYGRDYVKVGAGNDFPDDFDAVIDQRMVSIFPKDGGVELRLPPGIQPEPGSNVQAKASAVMKGELLLCGGRELIPEDAALAAMSGKGSVKCIKKPKVAFITSGNELVEAGAELGRGQIFDSNSPMVKVMLEDMGAEPHIFPIVRPGRDHASDALAEALKTADIVIYNGKLSDCLEDCESDEIFECRWICNDIAAYPGNDTDIAVINDRPVIGIHRDPLTTLYVVDWCVQSLVCAMLGRPYPVRTRVTAMLREDVAVSPFMETCVKLNVYRVPFGYAAYPVHDGGSLAEPMSANALFITEIGRDLYPAGSLIDVELRYEFDK